MSNKDVNAQKKCIKEFLKNLTFTERLIVVMYYYEEIPIPEIADSLELLTSEVWQMLSSIISRCKVHLREQGLS
jgi:DNA-directed RNA polymerase specialized sigma subunit